MGWGQNPAYPYQEGTYFGDVFFANAHGVPGLNAYFCEGPDFAAGVVPGRIGTDQGPTPYKNPWGSGGRCDQHCTPSDQRTNGRADGYKACNGWNSTVTVYRQTTYTPNFIGGYEYQLTNAAGGKSVQVNSSYGNYTTAAACKGSLKTSTAQLFRITKEGSKWKLVLKSDPSKCIDSWWSNNLNVAGCSANASSQQFTVTADNKGRFRLQNVASSNKYLTLNGSGNLELQDGNGSDAQAWKIGAIDLY